MPAIGRYTLYSVHGGRLTPNQEPKNFTASGGLIDRFREQTATSFLDSQRRRWFVRNRVYDLRGSASRVQSLKGELLIARADSKFVYSLTAGRQRTANSNTFASVVLTIFDADTLKELAGWDLPGTVAYDVLEVDGGLILVGKDEISRIPINLQSLLPTPTPVPPATP